MSAPSISHWKASSGAGTPSQLPGSSAASVPTWGGPARLGAARSAGAASGSRTLSLNRPVTAPPELVAVTVTMAPSSSLSVGMVSSPVVGSIASSTPATLKRSAAPEKFEITAKNLVS